MKCVLGISGYQKKKRKKKVNGIEYVLLILSVSESI